ncbi:MAG: Gfo/Idh/MocA family oxidoreductase [Patescibacteria group bacterium]
MQDPILLVGTGYMGNEYAKVLQAMHLPFIAVGRGEQHAKEFETMHQVPTVSGGLETWLKTNQNAPKTAIICTNEDQLSPSAIALMDYGTRSLLIEKPGGLIRSDIEAVAEKTKATGSKTYIAYNRRFYASTRKARELIKEDGGITAFHFEFTEWVHKISDQLKLSPTGHHWFLANSTHLIDLAFFLCGHPHTMESFVAGGFDWLDGPARFTGAGISEQGALFSYHATWDSAGRWWVEALTTKRKIVLRPLETLKTQMKGTVIEEEVPLDDDYDTRFKPGIYRQVESFLNDQYDLPTVHDQVEALSVYEKINGGHPL